MRHLSKRFVALLTALLLMGALAMTPVHAAGNITLYTPYHSLSVAPGESVTYSIDVINNTTDVQSMPVNSTGIPNGWNAQLTAGGHNVQDISVKPKDTQNLSLQIDVPLKVDKGTYNFAVNAGGEDSLKLSIIVTEQGTYKTELTTQQPNMQGQSDSTFTYSLQLNNHTAAKELYALKAQAPDGWIVKFTSGSKSVTSIQVDANKQQDITVDITPADKVTAQTYKIPITASSPNSSANTVLEAAVTGTYALELTTKDSNLNADITAGSTKNVTFEVVNKGTSPLSDIAFTSNTPTNWNVTFEPNKIAELPAGKTDEVTAVIKADKQAITGDYVVSVSAAAAQKSADAQLRMTVKTSVVWGWVGIFIIIVVIAGIYGLFRKYGRR